MMSDVQAQDHGYKILVASFGFDIDFVVRRLASKGFKKIVLLTLYTNEEAFRRIEKAYHTLSIVCKSMNIECRIEKLEPDKLMRSILSIIQAEVGDPKAERVEVYLTGGPRMLVIATLISALLLPERLVNKVDIVVEGEGFDCEAEIDLAKLLALLKLDSTNRKIVFELQTRGPQGLSELENLTGIPRSTLYRRLKELIEQGLIKRIDSEYIAEDISSITCKS